MPKQNRTPDGPNGAGMDEPAQHRGEAQNGGRDPMLNLPPVIVLVAVLLVGIHAFRMWLAPQELDLTLVLVLAFIPDSYGELATILPAPASRLWSPITYGLLHGNWTHLLMNLFWMAAFGSAVARRFGAVRFLGLSAVASAGGALAHYIFYAGDMVPMIGASGAVSGHMGAAGRFAFSNMRAGGLDASGRALGIVETFTNRQFVVFFFVWMALNLLFGAGIVPVGDAGQAIAWQAHIGGFLAGLLLFSIFDPQRPLNSKT